MTRRTLLTLGLALIALTLTLTTAWADEALKTPGELTEQAPDKYRVTLETAKGNIVIDVTREWAPKGADRFYNLVKHGFFDDTGFFRIVPNFVVQFGLNGDPALSKIWRGASIEDDPVLESNQRGTLTFATSGKNSRTTQLFINLKDNRRLDGMGFSPFGSVVEGMDVVEKLYRGYGERPQQGMIVTKGNAYLKEQFPKLDFITKATVEAIGGKQRSTRSKVKSE